MNNKIALIITAYNRPKALKKLLNSLNNIRCDEEIPLIISIDNKGTPDVNKIANDYIWKFGRKEVIIHENKKGLRDHFIWVGDQTIIYDNVIFLEDDLFVSKELIYFAKKAIQFYKDDEDVAGISLYNPALCEFTGEKFFQLQDGYDTYFLQHPYWGNIWMKEKWLDFKQWLKDYSLNEDILPKRVSNWKETSFKKIYIQYLAEKDKYMVLPRISLVTNNGFAGLHNPIGQPQYQVVIENEKRKYRFCECKTSLSVYDCYMELLPRIIKTYNKELIEYDFEVDLRGLRSNYKKEFVLTKRISLKPIIEFSTEMKPAENGVIYNVIGEGIVLSRGKDVVFDSKYDKLRQYKDVTQNYALSFRTSIKICYEALKKRISGVFR